MAATLVGRSGRDACRLSYGITGHGCTTQLCGAASLSLSWPVRREHPPHAHIHTLSPRVLLCDLCQYRDLAHCLWLHPQSAVKISQPQSCVCSCTSCTFFKHAMLPTRRRGTLFPAHRLFTIWCPFHMDFTFVSCQSAAYSSHVLAVLTRVLLSSHAP